MAACWRRRRRRRRRLRLGRRWRSRGWCISAGRAGEEGAAAGGARSAGRRCRPERKKSCGNQKLQDNKLFLFPIPGCSSSPAAQEVGRCWPRSAASAWRRPSRTRPRWCGGGRPCWPRRRRCRVGRWSRRWPRRPPPSGEGAPSAAPGGGRGQSPRGASIKNNSFISIGKPSGVVFSPPHLPPHARAPRPEEERVLRSEARVLGGDGAQPHHLGDAHIGLLKMQMKLSF